MRRFSGSLAMKLDFGETTTTAMNPVRIGRNGLRLAAAMRDVRGVEKYKALERRRRHAQIKARHLLDLA